MVDKRSATREQIDILQEFMKKYKSESPIKYLKHVLGLGDVRY